MDRARRPEMGSKYSYRWIVGEKASETQELLDLKEKALMLMPAFRGACAVFETIRGAREDRGDHKGVHRLAGGFAKYWNIPHTNLPERNYDYLTRTPFTANPNLEQKPNIVVRLGGMKLPFVELVIDLRWDAKDVEDAVLDVLAQARSEMEATERKEFRRSRNYIKRFRTHLTLYELAVAQGLPYREYVVRTDTKSGSSQFYSDRKRAKDFVEGRGYEGILPFLNALEMSWIGTASAPPPFGKYREEPLTVEVHRRVAPAPED
jgi:hypothetical protein